MDRWTSWKKRTRKNARRGWKDAQGYLDRVREETAPERKRLGREARRNAPKLMAFALATAFDVLRNYSGSAPRRRPRRAWKILLLVVAALAAARFLRSRDR